MRRKKKQTVRSFTSEDLKNKVAKLMNSRRRTLAPAPLTGEKLYRLAWTPEERTALKVCVKRKDLLRTGNHVWVKMPVMYQDSRIVVNINMTLKQPLPMPGYSLEVNYERLDWEDYDKLAAWAPLWLSLKQQQADLEQKVEAVGMLCNTYGQLYRLWPDILSLLNKEGAQRIAESKVRSAYPHNALLFRGAESLRAEYSPDAFAPFTSMIAECLMLPDNLDTELVTVTIA